jgi:hypothetical protein
MLSSTHSSITDGERSVTVNHYVRTLSSNHYSLFSESDIDVISLRIHDGERSCKFVNHYTNKLSSTHSLSPLLLTFFQSAHYDGERGCKGAPQSKDADTDRRRCRRRRLRRTNGGGGGGGGGGVGGIDGGDGDG